LNETIETPNSNQDTDEEITTSSSSSSNGLLCPSYEVTVGSEKFTADNSSCLISLKAIRAMGLPTDCCELLLTETKEYKLKKDDDFKVKLGYSDKLLPVFSGIVNNISHELSVLKVTAIGLAVGLLRLRLNRVYLSQTAGNIVSDLAQEAKIKVKTASDGINFPTYVVDDQTNGFEHVLKLAERCNFNTYVTEDDQLVFKEPGDGKDVSFRFGKDILRVEGINFSPLYTSARISGESPSSIKGSDTSHWLTKQEIKGEAGKGAVMPLQDSAIKDSKTAESVAKSRMSRLECTFGVMVEVVGKPEIKLGDSVTFERLPNSELNGPFEIRCFEHYISKTRGFTTKIDCWIRGGSP
jgi:phage protein D